MYYCQKCGKKVIVKYGSGKFCCRSCANTRIKTKQSIEKVSETARKNSIIKVAYNKKIYLENNPKRCIVCNKVIDYEHRYRKCCSENCFKKFNSIKAKKQGFGGLNKNSRGWFRGKRGTIKGISCDSCLELIFVLYCLDNNISIERNKKYFNYIVEGKKHKYYPDFYLPVDDMYIEIKGVDNNNVYEKLEAVKNQGFNIKIYHTQDLQEYIKYVREKYNIKDHHFEILYDNAK